MNRIYIYKNNNNFGAKRKTCSSDEPYNVENKYTIVNYHLFVYIIYSTTKSQH